MEPGGHKEGLRLLEEPLCKRFVEGKTFRGTEGPDCLFGWVVLVFLVRSVLLGFFVEYWLCIFGVLAAWRRFEAVSKDERLDFAVVEVEDALRESLRRVKHRELQVRGYELRKFLPPIGRIERNEFIKSCGTRDLELVSLRRVFVKACHECWRVYGTGYDEPPDLLICRLEAMLLKTVHLRCEFFKNNVGNFASIIHEMESIAQNLQSHLKFSPGVKGNKRNMVIPGCVETQKAHFLLQEAENAVSSFRSRIFACAESVNEGSLRKVPSIIQELKDDLCRLDALKRICGSDGLSTDERSCWSSLEESELLDWEEVEEDQIPLTSPKSSNMVVEVYESMVGLVRDEKTCEKKSAAISEVESAIDVLPELKSVLANRTTFPEKLMNDQKPEIKPEKPAAFEVEEPRTKTGPKIFFQKGSFLKELEESINHSS